MDFLIGKTIKVKIPARDNYGKELKNQFTYVVGECTYAGPNTILDIPLQVTVNRTPIRVHHINDIEIL